MTLTKYRLAEKLHDGGTMYYFLYGIAGVILENIVRCISSNVN